MNVYAYGQEILFLKRRVGTSQAKEENSIASEAEGLFFIICLVAHEPLMRSGLKGASISRCIDQWMGAMLAENVKGDTMTKSISYLFLIILAIFFTGCQSPDRLYKENATEDNFIKDRHACLQEASSVSSNAYANEYGTASSSHRMYLNCMNARGWHLVKEGGFIPEAGVPMKP